MTRLRIATVFLAILFSGSFAAADEILLSNGDRITGTVLRLAGGTLTFKTANGELKLPWTSVTSLKMDAPLLVTAGAAPAQSIAVNTAAGVGPLLRDITDIHAPEPSIVWSGGASAGMLATSGNTDVNSLRFDAEMGVRRARDRFTGSFVINHASTSGEETTSNSTTAFGYNRFLTAKLFAEASATFTHDHFKDLDLRSAIGGGVGYQVWDSPMGALTVNGGLGWVDENFATSEDDSYTALREGVKLDVFFANKRVKAFHHHEGYIGVTGDDNLFWRAQNGVNIAVAARLVLTAEIDADYDRSPAPGRKNTDRTFGLTLGYKF
jgi:putative salt-induced outer membrane protein YdiY